MHASSRRLALCALLVAACSSPERAERDPSFTDTVSPGVDAPADDDVAWDTPTSDASVDAPAFQPDPSTPWIDEPFPGDDPPATGGPIPVEIVAHEGGFQILRGGEPYELRGAGFISDLDALAEAGANTIRTWGVGEDTRALLDAAHARGMTVLVGLWLRHEADGFDYDDPAQVAAQLDQVRADVEALRDHPAVLMWGVGNEMELGNDEPAMWRAVGDAVAAVAALDPLHPTVVVTAEIGAATEQRLATYVPELDVWGINSYQGLTSLRDRLAERGWERPYLVTEFGGAGGWEVEQTSWGAPHEPTSSEKAAAYRAGFTAIEADPSCLGGFAFVWARADSPLDTWYTLLGPNGTMHEPVDAVIEGWTGTAPSDLAPAVVSFEAGIDGEVVAPGSSWTASLEAVDPEGAPLTWEWIVHRDALDTGSGAGAATRCSDPAGDASYTFEAPAEPGPYRLLGVARDPGGKAAFASARFYVDGGGDDDARLGLPLWVDSHFAFSGWMGDASNGHLTRQDCQLGDRYCSGACHAFALTRGSENWAGVVWQHPAGNWAGELPGAAIAPGATAVEFTAWGYYGGETIDVFVGGDVDGFEAKLEGLQLTSEPTTYRIPLRRSRYEDVTNGFGWISGAPRPDETKRFFIANVAWVSD